MKNSIFAFVVTACVAVGLAHGQDYEREARWRAEIEPTVIVGDPADLQVQERKVFAIFTPGKETSTAIVLAHGVGVHPDFGLIGKLRVLLADRGFSTLSVQMPVLAKEVTDANAYRKTFDEASRRLDSAARWLNDKGFTRVVLVSHSMGAWMSNVYFETAKQPAFAAWVCIGITGRIGDLGGFSGPVLDLYGEHDFKSSLDAAWLRKLKLLGRTSSQSVVVAGANHYFENKESEASQAIAAFLAALPQK